MPHILKRGEKKPAAAMPLTGHLRELRNRVAVCVAVLLVCCIVFIGYAEPLVDWFLAMGLQYGYTFVYLAPQELLMQYFKITVIASLCVCLPLLLYQLWAFARPGLSRSENLAVAFSLVFGLLCFLGGLYFAYKVTLPFMLYFLIHVGGSASGITATIGVENYLNFLLTIFIIFGCVFEMPMLSIVLTRLGAVTPKLLRKGRKVAVVIIFVLAAVITPPDVFSQFMVAVPMVLLYEFSILLSVIVFRLFRKKKLEEAAAD